MGQHFYQIAVHLYIFGRVLGHKGIRDFHFVVEIDKAECAWMRLNLVEKPIGGHMRLTRGICASINTLMLLPQTKSILPFAGIRVDAVNST